MIEESVIHQGMAFFLEHLPAYLHLILSSRVDPDLPLARLRAHGQLTEIRTDELRFQMGEASQFLDKMLLSSLSEEALLRLMGRTEGWIAGLHLIALTMQKRADYMAYLETLTGSQRYLLDYVQEDILACLSPDTRDFLLQIAILSRLDAAVCQAVTAAPTKAVSQQQLALLERANLFLMPLDEERRTYRLHDLFRETLLSVLHANQPERVSLLHRRAAVFYEAERQWTEAITHALAGSDFSMATRLMEQTVEQFWLRGEAESVARWFFALPELSVREHARLALTTALYLLATGANTVGPQSERYHQQARQLMARIESVLWQGHNASSEETSPGSLAGDREVKYTLLHWRLRLLHLYLVLSEVATSGDYGRLSRRQQEIEEELEHDEDLVWQMVPLACTFALHYSIRQEGARLLPHLLLAQERVSREAPSPASYKIRQWMVLCAIEAGRLHIAYEESLTALNLFRQLAGYTLLNGYFQLALIQVLYQWNRLVEARNLLHMLLPVAKAWQQLDLLTWGHVWLVKIALAIGDHLLADQSLYELECLMQSAPFADYPDRMPALRAEVWLTQGKLEAAAEWAESIIFPQGVWEGSGPYEALPVVIRIYFARRCWAEAVFLLERWRKHLDRPTNVRITITYLAQLLVALHQTGQRNQAYEVVARLFALTEPEGYLRVYLDEGEPMRQTLEALLTSHSQQHEFAPSIRTFISKLLAVFEQEQQGVGTSLAAPTPKPAFSSAQQASAVFSAPDVSLTRREQEVLRLLATGASNQDIAQTLVIALPTVKKHVSNLLGKLSASSRTQAISRARALSLL
ncbi:LuxR C-terminal-related transcriptional regulator [Ktedonospora formicarum]|uniref:HTH luxR-type domain-containing protein n=1 Tax=Ktedonospora formicarum TaxID=2778364 RepID=A0A8J3ICN1_9CHLR|nr:LuxR C-terminal-related transcriptional regulator [Ktedonospora formicarum]GHO48954.1 hypothetical protein KSX_71170 [Ktedonospora formicarum]